MVGIYKITSPTGRVYIGQAIDIHVRWEKNYKKLQCKKQPRLYNSLLKYSFSQHIFEVVEECKVEFEIWRQAEIKRIAALRISVDPLFQETIDEFLNEVGEEQS